MIEPVFSRGDINQTTTRLLEAEKPLINFLRVIDTLDVGRRINVGLTHEIHEIKSGIVENLLKKAEAERDFSEAKNKYLQEIDKLRDDSLQNFDSLITNRERGFIKDVLVDLNDQKREQLRVDFTSRLDQRLAYYKNSFDIYPESDLWQISTRLQEYVQGRRNEYEIMQDEQTEITEGYLNQLQRLSPTITLIKKKLEELRSDQPSNIYEACALGHAVAVKSFIEKEGKRPTRFLNKPEVNHQFRALDYAAYEGNPTITRYLLQQGADPKLCNVYKYTPLHWAAKNGNLDVGQELIDHGALVNVKGEYDRTPLHMATFQGHISFARMLLSREGIDCNARTTLEGHSVTALHNAVSQGYKKMILMLLGDNRVNPHLRSAPTRESPQGETPFEMAAMGEFKGDFSVINAFLEHPKFDRKDRDTFIDELNTVIKKTDGLVHSLILLYLNRYNKS